MCVCAGFWGKSINPSGQNKYIKTALTFYAEWRVAAAESVFSNSHVIVMDTGADKSSLPTTCWVLQVNWASESSFFAEYSRVEEVVERPVCGSTNTTAWMEIPGQKTNKHFKEKKNTAHTHTRMDENSTVHHSRIIYSIYPSQRALKTFVYVIFMCVKLL